MVDFIKAVIPKQYNEPMSRNKYLEFKQMLNNRTGELDSKLVAEYRGLKFIRMNNNYTELQGSLHKYFNNGEHNANDFGLTELLWVIIDIHNKFGLPIGIFRLANIEFGVNIEPLINSNPILNNLILHLGKGFKDVFVNDGNYKQAAHAQYYLKCYDKHKQYEGKFNLSDKQNLRIELKYKKMKPLNSVGLFTLNDLFDSAVLDRLHGLLLSVWGDTLLFDKTLSRGELTRYQKEVKWNQWNNPKYWLAMNKQRRYEQRKNYDGIVGKHSKNIHSQIGNLMTKKWCLLINNSLPIYRIINKHFVTDLQFEYSVSR